MLIDPGQRTDISGDNKETTMLLLAELVKHNDIMISGYRPVTTIEAGFPEEKSFTLPVQDAALSGKIKYSSIHPNQSHTEGWVQDGDSIFWTLDIQAAGVYKAEIQYGCPEGETGSKFSLSTGTSVVFFTIDTSFDSQILPDRDYVRRSESVERTWEWMSAGNIILESGPEEIILKLLQKKKDKEGAGLFKAIRLTKL